LSIACSRSREEKEPATAMCSPAALFLALTIAVSLSPSSSAGQISSKYMSTCETLPSEIHITKDEYDRSSLLVRTCEESVAVNKCEGACASSIQPSALNPRGFKKECHCCRETSYRQRQITLTNCFTSDGIRLTGSKGSMIVTVNEPVDCKCHECGKKMDAGSNHK
jgi:hypothetical protein